MVSAWRHHACLLSIIMVAFACSPTDDVEEPAEVSATDADELATGDPDIDDASSTSIPTTPPVVLGLNDVSILLPPPTSSSDPVLSITDLAFDGTPVWSDAAFEDFLTTADSGAGAVAGSDVANNSSGSKIDISAFADKAVWHVASIRIDPGAPGLSPDIAEAFGQSPQVRLVLQPVTAGKVHDVAAHLVFSYASPEDGRPEGCLLPRSVPDHVRFRQVVDDVVALRSRLAAGEVGDQAIDTGGLLGIHPAADPAKANDATRMAFRNELKSFLEAHLDPSNLRAMALMALPGGGTPEPWIFLAMAPNPSTGRFGPLPNPALAQDTPRFAQMLDARPSARSNPSVSPAVRANNLQAITCQFETPAESMSPEAPSGVSTAELFPNGDAERMREIVSVIADPTQAHFFNTDCVSCHTETRREMDILGTDEIDAPIDPAVLPTELWNVRNFGWFPSFLQRGALFATATRRTATETEEVLDAINADLAAR